jgi:hypothetical protein
MLRLLVVAQAQSHRRCCLSLSLGGLVAVRRGVLVVERGLQRALAWRLAGALGQCRCLRCLIATEYLVVRRAQLCAEVRMRRAEMLGRLLVAACRSLDSMRGRHRRRDCA